MALPYYTIIFFDIFFGFVSTPHFNKNHFAVIKCSLLKLFRSNFEFTLDVQFRGSKYKSVFSLTLARSPMASRSYRRASDFLNYSPGLASDILAEWSRKMEEKRTG